MQKKVLISKWFSPLIKQPKNYCFLLSTYINKKSNLFHLHHFAESMWREGGSTVKRNLDTVCVWMNASFIVALSLCCLPFKMPHLSGYLYIYYIISCDHSVFYEFPLPATWEWKWEWILNAFYSNGDIFFLLFPLIAK